MKKNTISMSQELTKEQKFISIFNDSSELTIWEQLDNGCYIGTMGYSEENIYKLLALLKSFEEQYGEKIDYEAAKEELMLYQNKGKLFIYFDENLKPVSMNGCIYNYDNETVEFLSINKKPTNLYFYGLSTIPEYRGKGACRHLIEYAIDFAKYNNFDLVYARTDLVNSNSEWLMAKAGMEICKYNNDIIAEWVDVTETEGDYRLHMWKPLHSGIILFPKDGANYANDDEKRTLKDKTDTYQYKYQYQPKVKLA